MVAELAYCLYFGINTVWKRPGFSLAVQNSLDVDTPCVGVIYGEVQGAGDYPTKPI